MEMERGVDEARYRSTGSICGGIAACNLSIGLPQPQPVMWRNESGQQGRRGGSARGPLLYLGRVGFSSESSQASSGS